MSGTIARGSLFEHALRLHRLDPDSPLPRDGHPFPDEEIHRRRPWRERDQRRVGADVARLLDKHFATGAPPSALAEACHGLYIPIHHNDHVAAAALRADRQRARATGRWLVRHGTDRCAVLVGLALLAIDGVPDDIPLIQTIGLLSETFGALAADALRRRQGRAQALMWLARRVEGWGRVYVIEALCDVVDDESRRWLLRHACNGDLLNGYYAGRVATAANLCEAITDPGVDDVLVDHTARLLLIMADCEGMAMTLAHYPQAQQVLAAHVDHLGRQEPTAPRYRTAALIAYHLTNNQPIERWAEVVSGYRTVLNRQEWCDSMNAEVTQSEWFRENLAGLGLKAING